MEKIFFNGMPIFFNGFQFQWIKIFISPRVLLTNHKEAKHAMSKQRNSRMRNNTPYPICGNARKRHTADFLGISDATLNRWVKLKKIPLPFELDAGLIVFDAEEIRNWVEEKKIQRIQ